MADPVAELPVARRCAIAAATRIVVTVQYMGGTTAYGWDTEINGFAQEIERAFVPLTSELATVRREYEHSTRWRSRAYNELSERMDAATARITLLEGVLEAIAEESDLDGALLIARRALASAEQRG